MMMEASNLKVANALLLIFNQNNKRPGDMDIYNRCLAKKLKKADHRMKAFPLSPYNRGSCLHGIADDISMTFVRAATVDPGTFCSTKTLFSLHSQGRVREKKLYDRFEADRAVKEAREAAIEEEERRMRKEKAEQAKKEALVQKLQEKKERRQMRAEANRLAEQQMMAAEEQHVYDAEEYRIEMEKQLKLEEELRIKREEEERIREAEEKAECEKMEEERARKAEEAVRRRKAAEEAREKREEELRLKREAQAARKKKQQEERARKAAEQERLEEEEEERVRQAEKEAQLKREEDAARRQAAKEARRQKLQEEASLRKAAKEARTKELEQQARMEEERRAWKLTEAARMEREHAKQQSKAKREEAARIKAAEEAAQQQAEAKAKAAAEAKKEKEQKKQAKLAAREAAREAAKVLTTPKKRGRPSKKHSKKQQVVNISSPAADLSGSSGSPGCTVPTSERSTVVSGDHIMFKFARDDCWQVGIVRHACAKSRGKQKQAKKARKTSRPKVSDAHHWFNVFFAHNKSMLVLHLTPEGKGSDWLFVQDVSPVAWRTALKVGDELEMLDCQAQSQWVPGRVTHVDESAQMMTMQEDLTGAVTRSHIQNGCNFAPPHTFIAVAHIEDDHHSLCTKCGIGGDVLLCDSPGCPAVWHTHCADLAVIPEGDFVCPLHQ